MSTLLDLKSKAACSHERITRDGLVKAERAADKLREAARRIGSA